MVTLSSRKRIQPRQCIQVFAHENSQRGRLRIQF